MYVYKSLRGLAVFIVLREKNLMKCKKKMLKIEVNVFGRKVIVIFLWYNDLFFGKAIFYLSLGKYCIYCKFVYLDLKFEGFVCI